MSNQPSSKSIIRDRYGAKSSYNRLRLNQPHINEKGLWEKNEYFYVWCPEFETEKADDGRPIDEWFDGEKSAVCAITIVKDLPPDVRRVPELTIEDRIRLLEEPLTHSDFNDLVAVQLGGNFPSWKISFEDDGERFCVAEVARELSSIEQTRLVRAIEILGFPVRIRVSEQHTEQGKAKPVKAPRTQDSRMTLLPSRYVRKNMGAAVADLVEADEEFWISHRSSLFTEEKQSAGDFLPDYFAQDSSSCLVDCSVFPPQNLRTYLSIYHVLYIVVPLEDKLTPFFAAAQVNQEDIFELARIGRVKFLIPQSVERYSAHFICEAAEKVSSSLLFSRRLCAATVVDARRRNPLFYPPFDIAERKIALRYLREIANNKSIGPIAQFYQGMYIEFKRIWSHFEYMLNLRGAMGTGALGIGALASVLYKSIHNRDLSLEFYSSAWPVEWASALNATVIPFHSDEFSTQTITELLASTYTGIQNNVLPNDIGSLQNVVQGLLTIDNDASIADFCAAFSGTEIDRFRKIAFEIAAHNQDEEYLHNAIEEFNTKVERFEKSQIRLRQLDIVGLLSAGTSIVASQMPDTASACVYVPLVIWLAKTIVDRKNVSKRLPDSRLLDTLNAINSFTNSDVVLVGRLRSCLRKE